MDNRAETITRVVVKTCDGRIRFCLDVMDQQQKPVL